MKVIGKYSVAKEDIVVTIPKIRKVGNKLYPYKSKYLGGGEDGYILTRSDIEKDLLSVLGIRVRLISKNSRGGEIVEMS